MNIRKDIKVEGKHGRPVLLDTYYMSDGTPKPLIVFAHGFKGFKDWGHWHLVAKAFAEAGFYFVKFNFSHNGTTPEAPSDFGDLETFGQNNYSKEEADVDTVLEWLAKHEAAKYDPADVTLVGHSRGGGLAIVKANRDARIHRLITWASVSNLGYFFSHPSMLESWRESGVWYILNGRTKQQMPLYYQLYEDYIAHEGQFDVKAAAKELRKPWLILHGSADPAVPLSSAKALKAWNPSAKLVAIEGADHVFGGRHPYTLSELPPHSRQLVDECLHFLKNNNL